MLRLSTPLRYFRPIKALIRQKSNEGYTTMGDPIDVATGIEKRELLAQAAGNPNPFHLYLLERTGGTRESPIEIPSAMDARIVGCLCEKDSTFINYFWLHLDSPKRCECGHWFKIVPIAPV